MAQWSLAFLLMIFFSGLTIPEGSAFGVPDICALIGGRRIIDVVDCESQKSVEMSMREFEQYHEEKHKSRKYRVNSLEYSRSRLESFVQRPNLIDYLDWVDLVWPQHLKQSYTFQNAITYPKVQRYCSISVRDSYTDFHINFGGTCAWHYLQKGQKILWLIPPTDENHRLYEAWVTSGQHNEIFFADMVPDCQRATIEQGTTIIVPSGWIFAEYASKDSISFGGNFLSSFTIPMQLQVYEIEERCKCPTKYRFPFFTEIHWYALERHVHSLTNQCFLTEKLQAKAIPVQKKSASDDQSTSSKEHIHLTTFEYEGLKTLVDFLHNLPKHDRKVPDGIEFPDKLLKAGKDLVSAHRNDDPGLSVTGKPTAYWPEMTRNGVPKKIKPKPKPLKPHVELQRKPSNSSRVRRVRCKECTACLRDDCMECVFCLDMRKHGGPGTMKQTCIKRRCLNPTLPSTASEVSVVSLVKPSPEPQAVAKKEKRALESEDVFVPMKIAKTEEEDYIDEGAFDDTMDLLPRSISVVKVSKIPAKVLFKYPIPPVIFPGKESNAEPPTNPLLAAKFEQVWLSIFQYLTHYELSLCMLVCKDFLKICGSSKLWKNINLSGKRMKPVTLQSVVRKCPKSLNLSQTNISFRQLLWLLERSPNLRSISLQGCSWSAAAALSSAACPSLKSVDLSWISGFTDPHLKHLLSTPKDCRPGQKLSHTRLRFCEELSLSGTDVTDKSVKLITQLLPNIRKIDLSFCSISNDGIGYLTSSSSKVVSAIVAQHCHKLTDQVFKHIGRLQTIEKIDLRNCSKVTPTGCREFIDKSSNLILVEALYIVAVVS